MNRIGPVFLIAIVMLAAALWLLIGQADAPSDVNAPEPAERAVAPPSPLAERTESTPLEAMDPEREAAPTPERSVVMAAWDPDARGDLTIKVLDLAERPVSGANVTFWALRSKQTPGSHFGWRGDEPTGRTDAQGEVTMWFPVWVAERHETSVVTVRVDHPHFVSKNQDIPIENGEHRITIERGTFVTVSGWIGTPDRMVLDVDPRATDDSRVRTADWIRSPGNKPSTHKMAEGHHALYLKHDAGGKIHYSDVVEFDLQKGDTRDFHLELHEPRRLRGTLDASVPRPIENGTVMLNLFINRGDARASREFTAQVAADGSFELLHLPNGSGQIIGRCDDWISIEEAPEPPPEAPDGFVPQPEPQRIEIGGDVDDFVLRMQPAATMVATVVDPDGTPVAGARVVLWPNVSWGHGYSNFFLDAVYEALTDDRGVARVRSLPPGREGYHVSANNLQMPLRNQGSRPPERKGEIDLSSGQIHEIEVRMERVK